MRAVRALVWHGPRQMSVDDVPDAAPGPGEALLAPEAVGICGSEVEGYLGHQANRRPPLVMGHELAGRVVALGDGTIGLMTLQAALIGGADWVGVIELHPARRALAEALGAHGSYSAESVPGDVDLVFDAVGVEGTRRLAIDLLRPGGCAVMIGLASQSTPVRFDEVIRRGLTVRGSYAYSDDDYDEALQWLLDGRAGLGELEPVQPLDAGPQAFAELATGPSERLKVFLA